MVERSDATGDTDRMNRTPTGCQRGSCCDALHYYIVFGTKDRAPIIVVELILTPRLGRPLWFAAMRG